MALNGNDDEVNGYNSVVKNGVLPNADLVKSMFPPIGSLFAWMKTFDSKDSGAADTNTLNKLEDSGGGFVAAGIAIGNIVANTTDGTYGYVKAVDSDTVLSIATITSGVNLDLFPLGTEAYNIYSTPTIPDGWVECNGQVLSDSDSPFNGATIPDLNTTPKFLRGAEISGTTGGSDTHSLIIAELAAHTHTMNAADTAGGSQANWLLRPDNTRAGTVTSASTGSGTAHENKPAYYSVTWIMRIK